MENIIIDTEVCKDENGRPMLRLLVRGREVKATFSNEKNSEICPRLKQTLIDSYLRNAESGTIAC